MPDRYNFQKITKTEDGKRHFQSTINPNISVDINDVMIVARMGDRLDTLANKYYNDPSYWWIIAEANGLGKGSLFITPGKFVRIPMNLAKISEEQTKINKGR
jgi:hypothetical protein